ncbi:MAG: type II toxin-antitoxin system prevent-host-death family antitoxin [Deltaproteobacteria bacterium]|uniref:type II toxin-antitoxin system Phd/YefM family antitoxin n=1 Tax=Candidatus Deferrimicrobium sp. TaxID=3060586 RepID=UPI002717AA44|nr:type II toxin-antitoxin system prevent-host-death family antitoxin [Candidatus Deferrimicrobium sp.]MCR4310756.1 type II toxin-antitoxin system prevent-host-death family antitoxin [Deltaproteobacteria bacterium]MDO8737563.1 type II toxin-antitoxin system prevent-host-death family antitoxin [Candidatus Deferrimicrobium sp.]
MRSAAISRLKASLSEYLDVVRAGEEVLVTDRGKPIARIVPIPGGRGPNAARMKEMAAAGILRLGKGNVSKGFWSIRRPADPGGLALRAMQDEREGGR